MASISLRIKNIFSAEYPITISIGNVRICARNCKYVRKYILELYMLSTTIVEQKFRVTIASWGSKVKHKKNRYFPL